MKKLTFFLTILAGLISACNLTDKGANPTSQLSSESENLERLKSQKKLLDNINHTINFRPIELVKLSNKVEPILVVNGKSYDNIETRFVLLKDSIGNIVSASEYPFSESGDWIITFTHYFDKDGKTFAFERQTNFFNSICTD